MRLWQQFSFCTPDCCLIHCTHTDNSNYTYHTWSENARIWLDKHHVIRTLSHGTKLVSYIASSRKISPFVIYLVWNMNYFVKKKLDILQTFGIINKVLHMEPCGTRNTQPQSWYHMRRCKQGRDNFRWWYSGYWWFAQEMNK